MSAEVQEDIVKVAKDFLRNHGRSELERATHIIETLCSEVDKVKLAFAGHLFDGESVNAREAVRTELISELSKEVTRLQALNPDPISKQTLLDQTMWPYQTLLGSLFLTAFAETFPVEMGGGISADGQKIVDADKISLVLFANGVPMDATKATKQWDKQVDRMIAQKAKELVEEKLRNLYESLDSIEQSIKRHARDEMKKAGLPFEEEEW